MIPALNAIQPFLLTFAAGLFALTASKAQRRSEVDAPRWRVLSVLFLVLSFDEILHLHEFVLEPIRTGPSGEIGAILFPLLPTGMIAIYLAPMLRRMPVFFAIGFTLCAIGFVGSAMILEAAPGLVNSLIEEWAEAISITVLFIVIIRLGLTFRESSLQLP